MKKTIKIILIVLGILLGLFILGYILEIDNKYIKAYKPGTGNIKGNFDTSYFEFLGTEFEVGANWHGYVVFKHPEKAVRKLEELYSDTIKLLAEYTEREFKISKRNAYIYANVCRTISHGELDDMKKIKELESKYHNAGDYFIVGRVLDVYIHSYNRTISLY